MPKTNLLKSSYVTSTKMSVVISRIWCEHSSAVKFIVFRSCFQFWDMKAEVSVLILRPEVQGLGLDLKTTCLMSMGVAWLS